MTPQLDTVIIEVSSLRGLSQRGTGQNIILSLMNWTYMTGFYSGQSSYLNVKVLLIFAKDENMHFFFKTTANLIYGQKCKL